MIRGRGTGGHGRLLTAAAGGAAAGGAPAAGRAPGFGGGAGAVPSAACPPPAAPTAPGPRGPTACERASDSMVLAMLARLPSGDPPPTETADALRNLIRERCERDGWSADATRCLAAMQRVDDAASCAALLTDAQQAALARDEEARLSAAAHGDGSSGNRRGDPGHSAGEPPRNPE